MSNEESERITTSQDVISRLHDKIDEQHARIVELEAQIAAAQQASEPYAVLVFERGEEGPFDRKPVKPGSVQHLHAKRDPHYDYVELYTHPTQQGMDVIAGAIALCKHAAKIQNIDFDDYWAIHSDEFKEEAQLVLDAAQAKQGAQL